MVISLKIFVHEETMDGFVTEERMKSAVREELEFRKTLAELTDIDAGIVTTISVINALNCVRLVSPGSEFVPS
jgi:hypothetical protein